MGKMSEHIWGANLREYIWHMHQVDIVWLPSEINDEPPF